MLGRRARRDLVGPPHRFANFFTTLCWGGTPQPLDDANNHRWTMHKFLAIGVLLLGTFIVLSAAPAPASAQDLRKKGALVGRIESNGDVRISGAIVGRFESNGDIRVRGAIEGRIESNGDIRKRGSIVGRVESNGDVRESGSIVGRIESNGDVRHRGTIIGKAQGVPKERAAAVFFFDFFKLP